MNKKGMEFKSALFAIATIGVFIAAIGAWVNGWNAEYDSGLIYDLNEFDNTRTINNQSQGFQTDISPEDPNRGTDFEGRTYRSVFGIIANIYEPFRVVFGNNGMIDKVTERFGIPDYFRMFLVSIMGIAIAFTIIAIIFRLPWRSG